MLFDTLFDTVGEGQGAWPKKRLKGKIQTSRASKGLETTNLNWFNVAQLAWQTPVPEVSRRPPSEPVRLGSDFTRYETDSLAWHYLGVHYTVAFVADRSSVKDTLRMALAKHDTHKRPMALYADVWVRSTNDAPLAMSSSQDLLVSHFRPLGT